LSIAGDPFRKGVEGSHGDQWRYVRQALCGVSDQEGEQHQILVRSKDVCGSRRQGTSSHRAIAASSHFAVQFSINDIIPGAADAAKNERHGEKLNIREEHLTWSGDWIRKTGSKEASEKKGIINVHDPRWLVNPHEFGVRNPCGWETR